MENTKDTIHVIFDRWFNGQLTEADLLQLNKLSEDPSFEELLPQELKFQWENIRNTGEFSLEQTRRLGQSILKAYPASENKAISVHRVHFLKTAWFRYAAILLLITGTATFLYLKDQPQQQTQPTQLTEKPAILPGGNKAVLTLANGSTITLDSAAIGNLAQQGDVKIVKLDAGALAYTAGNTDGEVLYNTISTPRGGQYQITLPDNTKVWLNAASSIRFPTTFVKERNVTITGEAYFEITTDKSKPFLVTANNVQVKVLGTSFNINSYSNEGSTRTTLLEGAVSVSLDAGNSKLLKPGQQAVATDAGALEILPANVQQVIAWKDGVFNFYEADLKQVMRQLARWYDIEVVYEGKIPEKKFWGEMYRGEKFDKVLAFLEKSGVHFTVEEKGRRLVITP